MASAQALTSFHKEAHRPRAKEHQELKVTDDLASCIEDFYWVTRRDPTLKGEGLLSTLDRQKSKRGEERLLITHRLSLSVTAQASGTTLATTFTTA